MYLYTAYCLGISSELALPELVHAEKGSDVAIRLRKLNGIAQAATEGEKWFLGETANVGMFAVQDGHEILVDPAPGVDEALLRTILLGPILAVLLRQRGLLVLHGSGIAINGAAVVFLAGSGWGKSTLALSFYARGCGVITDDVVAVRTGPSYPAALPSYPRVKLLPDVAAFLGYTFEQLPQLHVQSEKRVCPVTCGFPQTPLPLKRIYVLDVGARHAIEPLGAQDAFVELVRNSRAVGLLRSASFINTHFYQCARLVENVSIRRLKRQPSLSALPDIARLVEEDLT